MRPEKVLFNETRLERLVLCERKGENSIMPTINQLVRQGRQKSVVKSKAPALGKGRNLLLKKEIKVNSPQKKGVCLRPG